MPTKAQIIAHFKQMALTPRKQLKQLLVGTVGGLLAMIGVLIASHFEQTYWFYLFASIVAICLIYALPGYIGIWLWRMRKFLFDLH